MTFKDRMLEIVKAHPDGITTIEMAVKMGGSWDPDAKTLSLRSNIGEAGKVLEKYGLVRRDKIQKAPWDLRKITIWYPIP